MLRHVRIEIRVHDDRLERVSVFLSDYDCHAIFDLKKAGRTPKFRISPFSFMSDVKLLMEVSTCGELQYVFSTLRVSVIDLYLADRDVGRSGCDCYDCVERRQTRDDSVCVGPEPNDEVPAYDEFSRAEMFALLNPTIKDLKYAT